MQEKLAGTLLKAGYQPNTILLMTSLFSRKRGTGSQRRPAAIFPKPIPKNICILYLTCVVVAAAAAAAAAVVVGGGGGAIVAVDEGTPAWTSDAVARTPQKTVVHLVAADGTARPSAKTTRQNYSYNSKKMTFMNTLIYFINCIFFSS